MRYLIMPLLAVLVLLVNSSARAEGLLYQLPADGVWVRFDTKVNMKRGEQTRDTTGYLRMASVGTETVDEKSCRWIEFKMSVGTGDMERIIVAKLLVPESQLQAGQKPVENLVRGWVRMGVGRDVVALTAQNLGPIPAFLANPLTDVKQLESKTIDSPLGKLSCEGVTGRTEFTEPSSKNKVEIVSWRHKNAPFGVVSSRMKVDVIRGEEVAESLDITLTVGESGQAATSELPDHH